jgi:Spy/CpxP family protein refolding chaperone
MEGVNKMANSNLYGNYTAIAQQRADNRKPQLKVDKKTEQRINSEIKILQEQRDKIYDDLSLSDEELRESTKHINEKINQLIDSMYETKEEVQKRLKR